MKLRIFVFLCLLIGCSQPNKQLTKECMLITPYYKTIGCGVLSVWEGMKFVEIKNNQIFIGLVHCPDSYDSTFFKLNKKYIIQLDFNLPDSSKNLIINPFEKEGLPCYTIKSISAIN